MSSPPNDTDAEAKLLAALAHVNDTLQKLFAPMPLMLKLKACNGQARLGRELDTYLRGTIPILRRVADSLIEELAKVHLLEYPGSDGPFSE